MIGSVMPATTDNVVTAAAGLFPVKTEAEVFSRITAMFNDRRITPGALAALLDALEAQPHVNMGEPADARERNMADRCMVDAMRDAGQTVRDETSRLYDRTPHARAQGSNFCFVHNQTDEGDVDECAICAAPKSQCPKVAEHFGAKGESPPYTECPECARGFHNNYDSTKRLALHRAAEGECKPHEREMHELAKNPPPRPLSASCWGAPRPAKKARAKGGVAKK